MATVKVFGAVMVACGLALPVHAATVSISNSNAGAANSVDGLLGFETTGAMMNGMLVTASFSNGSSSTVVWATTGATAGAAIGTNWSVGLAGDSFNSPFEVSHSAADLLLVSLFFQGAPGDTVFDTVFGVFLTPNSASGRPYSEAGNAFGGNINVTYSRPLSIAGVFYGDLYVNMLVDYSGLTRGGLQNGQVLRFVADTDNVKTPGDIRPVPPIPLPAAGWLMLAGLCGLGLVGRRRRTDA